MSTIAIDTHKAIEKRREKGFTQQQAEGFVEALTDSDLVTKSHLDIRLSKLETSIIKWVALLLLGQAAVIAALQSLLG